MNAPKALITFTENNIGMIMHELSLPHSKSDFIDEIGRLLKVDENEVRRFLQGLIDKIKSA